MVKRVHLQDAGHSANSLKCIFQTSVCEYKITNMKIRHFNTSNFLFSQVYKPQDLKLTEKWHPFLQNYFTLSITPNSKLHLLLLHIPSHPTSLFPGSSLMLLTWDRHSPDCSLVCNICQFVPLTSFNSVLKCHLL